MASSVTLFQSSLRINQMLPQMLHIRLVDSLLNCAPDFGVNWIEVMVVWWPQILLG